MFYLGDCAEDDDDEDDEDDDDIDLYESNGRFYEKNDLYLFRLFRGVVQSSHFT